jgi:hypothetical protein
MFIRRLGRQPDEGFASTPNEAARDARLSWAARGILTYLLSHRPGWSVTTADVEAAGPQGREAVRRAFRELEAAGYIRRIREQDERGRIVRWINLYPYGDADVESSDDGDIPDGPDPDGMSPEAGFQGTVFRAQVSRSPSRTPSTEDHSSLPVVDDDAATTQEVTNPHSVGGAAAVSHSVTPTTIPVVLQRRLRDMGVVDGTAWTSAWQAATSVEWPEFAAFEAEHFPEEHLMLHLLQQQDRGQAISPSRWLRFFLEDRQRRITAIAGQIEQEARMSETPQEREDRLNRRLPPIWPDEPRPAATTGEKS